MFRASCLKIVLFERHEPIIWVRFFQPLPFRVVIVPIIPKISFLWIVNYLILFIWSMAAVADPLPIAPFQAHYQVALYGIPLAKTQITLTAAGKDHYHLQAVSQLQGVSQFLSNDSPKESSDFLYQTHQIVPVDYRIDRADAKRRVRLDFDWQQHKLLAFRKQVNSERVLALATLDRLSASLQLMVDLNRDPHRGILDYEVAEPKKTKHYQLHRVGEEKIHGQYGEVTAVKLRSYQKDKENPGETTFWCAARLQYLPVKIEHQDEEKRISIELITVAIP